MLNDFEDRRSFLRLARILDLKIINLDTNTEGKAKTHDISATGMGFITDTPLNREANLELLLYIPDNQEPVYAKGRVVWTNMIAPNTYRVGVSLDKVDFVDISRVLRIYT
jgi:c-di-GMP-binding flagellar brake protein YcgR